MTLHFVQLKTIGTPAMMCPFEGLKIESRCFLACILWHILSTYLCHGPSLCWEHDPCKTPFWVRQRTDHVMLIKVIKVRRKEAISIVSEQSQVKSVHWADLGPWAGPLGKSSTLEIYAGVAEGLLRLHQVSLEYLTRATDWPCSLHKLNTGAD